jgi:hypothetical protein
MALSEKQRCEGRRSRDFRSRDARDVLYSAVKFPAKKETAEPCVSARQTIKLVAGVLARFRAAMLRNEILFRGDAILHQRRRVSLFARRLVISSISSTLSLTSHAAHKTR